MSAAESVTAPSKRLQSIDWLRGLVMILMTLDHVGDEWNGQHFSSDAAYAWHPHDPLPAAEFLTRWLAHLCAPTFVLLAGTALALSSERRQQQPGQTAFIVKRGLVIATIGPLWMSLGFARQILVFQVLYAIGLSLVCMAFLRRLSSAWLLGGAVAIALYGELTTRWQPATQPLQALWIFLFTGGPPFRSAFVAYPLIPWLSVMMVGWVLGRWLLATRHQPTSSRVATLVAIGCGLLVVFAIVRGLDGYGNWGLHRDSSSLLQWLHVAKYPPSLSYTTLELGLAFLWLALFFALEQSGDGRPRRWLEPLAIFGSTAMFFYLLHVHVIVLAALVAKYAFHADFNRHGLLKTYSVTLFMLLLFLPICRWYRGYKSRHADGWTRYI